MMRNFIFLFRQTFTLYGAIAFILLVSVNGYQAHVNYLNFLKNFDAYVMDYLKNREPLKRPSLWHAVRYYKELAKHLPDNAFLYGNTGLCYFLLGDYDNAIKSYRMAIAMAPNLYTFYDDLGIVYFKMGNYTFAAKNFEKSFELLDTMIFRPELEKYLFEKSPGNGRNIVQPDKKSFANKIEADKEEVYIHLAAVYLYQKEFKKTHGIAQRGIAMYHGNAKFYFLVGLALVNLRDYHKAIEYFTAAVALNKNYSDAHAYRDLCLRELNREKQGKNDLVKQEDFKKTGEVMKPGGLSGLFASHPHFYRTILKQ